MHSPDTRRRLARSTHGPLRAGLPTAVRQREPRALARAGELRDGGEPGPVPRRARQRARFDTASRAGRVRAAASRSGTELGKARSVRSTPTPCLASYGVEACDHGLACERAAVCQGCEPRTGAGTRRDPGMMSEARRGQGSLHCAPSSAMRVRIETAPTGGDKTHPAARGSLVSGRMNGTSRAPSSRNAGGVSCDDYGPAGWRVRATSAPAM